MSARKPAYSLVVVLLTLGLVTVALFCLMAFMEAGVKTSGDNIERRKMFYVCDGMARIVGEKLREFVRQGDLGSSASGSAALKGYLESADVGGGPQLPNLVPAGFTLLRYNIDNYAHVGDDVAIPTGAFAGMVGSEDKLRVLVTAQRADGKFACTSRQEVSLTQIGMFQMTLWSAIPKAKLYFNTRGTDALLAIMGRVHAQGDVDISEGPDTAAVNGVAYVEHLTAAGIIHGSQGCAEADSTPFLLSNTDLGGAGPVLGSTMLADARFPKLGDTPPDPLSGQPCNDATWLNAISSFSRQIGDARVGVQPLALPLTTRAGEELNPLRFLVDPVTDDASVDERERKKLAYKADVRIIDGVWFIANPANRADFPGLPIWSDHPGKKSERFVVGGALKIVDVGQEDLRLARSWSGTPRRFSPYGYIAGSRSLDGGNEPVVAYGTLNRAVDGAAPSFAGIKDAATDETSIGCTRVVPASPPAPATYSTATWTDLHCATWTPTAKLLSGASWGFQDINLVRNPTDLGAVLDGDAVKEGYGNVSPIDFDVYAFHQALKDTSRGELGSYFRGASRQFNGIVWISSRWPVCVGPTCPLPTPSLHRRNSWTHPEPLYTNMPEPAVLPPVPPHFYFGAQPSTSRGHVESDAPAVSHPALPYPLCSDNLSGTAYDDPAFGVHSCSGPYYSVTRDPWGGAHAAFPNALLVHHASNIYQPGTGLDQLPKGLTIATNLPAYVVGDVNTSSTPAANEGERGRGTSVPFAVAADNVVLLSSAFIPNKLPWWNRVDRILPPAATGTFNVALMTGVATGTGSCTSASALCGDSVLTGFHLMEGWDAGTNDLVINGSIVVGYHSKYVNPGFPLSDQEIPADNFSKMVAWPRSTVLRFDHNLGRLAGQPPGTEALGIQTIRQWERD